VSCAPPLAPTPYCPSVESETISPALAEPLRAGKLALRSLRRVPLHIVVVVCLAIAWLIVAPNSPDLAAQDYRSYLFAHFGMLVWDDNWYGGHHIPGYSLLYPPLAWLIGIRLAGALAVVASAALFGQIAKAVFGPNTRLASIWFAVAVAGDLWIGRLTFALGVTFALAAILTVLRGRGRPSIALAALLAAMSAASSPVAGALLALAALTDALANRRLRYALILIIPVLVVILPLQALFPEGGFEPYGLESFLPSTAVALVFIWALPSREHLLRLGGWLFVLVNVLSLLPTPMGSNVVRYAVLLAGPLLLCAIARGGGFSVAGKRPFWALGAVLIGIAFWVLWGPIVQSSEVLGDPSTQAAYYRPLRQFLATHAKGPIRIEVPFTRSHWEAALLAPHVALARGWERQLDKRYNEAIEADPLAPSVYRRWLDENAVSYVALPDVPLDGSSVGEAALIRHGAPFLQHVFTSAHWQVYRVLGATPLLQGPGRLTTLGHQGFTLDASAPGNFLVRVHYTPYWSTVVGQARITEASGNWTQITVSRPGVVRVQAQFSLDAALEALARL
jgi:hypothetical protein